ncbi:MAG: APC family permease, partial [Acidobacteriota bacterium]|nr:APC family permease [Acidobacteriota bacterium]
MGLLGLTATGVCSMVGAGINVIPFMIQRNVPGIGGDVLAAFAFAAVPAMLAGLAYAVLASAMPRAGGSYIYASRALDPYLGFVASFSQWFSLCVAIGVVSYVLVPFLRDIATALQWDDVASSLDGGLVRVTISLGVLWAAVGLNLLGVTAYERLIVPLMFLTFVLGGVVIVAGFSFDQTDFAAAVLARDRDVVPATPSARAGVGTFLSASALLFASFIGFDSIAQAGGEAKNPGRNLPLAIGIAVVSVGLFYMLFTAAVYHAVPWAYIAEQAQRRDLTAPGLLGYLLSPFWTVVIVSAAAVALVKDLPAMLLAVSRLMFAWAEDGIFPKAVAA